MATIHREGGISFRVYPKDHPPAHVHAFVGWGYAKIELPTAADPARIVRIVGKMKDADVARAVETVQDKADIMWEGWNRFHG
ncbi:MAG: DUF4160 domain-containing protein [Gemmatimonadetes bacterium]|nr:DUF4160 domain-containing protein [Gemmatimonadota bacterium]